MHPSLAAFTFGVEFEVLLPRTLPRHSAAAEFTRVSGFPCNSDFRIPTPANSWKVVADGSLRGRGRHGLEFVSPILQGEEGLAQVRRAANALRLIGAKVNATCGLHVHVGGHGGELQFFKTLVKLYGRFETAFDSIMPETRRGNGYGNYRYCRSVALGMNNIDNCNSKEEIAYALTRASRADSGKYHKVNVIPLGKPTVEFRHHHGTVNADKATNWVLTCLRLVAAAKDGKTGETAARRVRQIAWDLATLRGKALHVATLVSRDGGATNEEIRNAFGYATISGRTQLLRSGLAFETRRDRVTGKDRFFAVHSTETVSEASEPVPTTLDGLFDVLGSDASERAFYARRRELVVGDRVEPTASDRSFLNSLAAYSGGGGIG